MTTMEEALSRPGPSAARRTDRIAVHTFRPYRSWPVLAAGGVLVAVAGVAAAEVISALVGSPLSPLSVDRATEYAAEARWSAPTVRVASGVLTLIGLLLIALALLPGGNRWLASHPRDPGLVAGLSRGALRRSLATAVREVEGVRGARVALGRHRVRVRVEAAPDGDAEVSSTVHGVVERKITELALAREPRIDVDVRRPRA